MFLLSDKLKIVIPIFKGIFMVSRVLVTDDEERIIRNIRIILDEMENIEVVKAQDVTSIVDFVEHERLHLIITDLRVPRMGRLEFLKQIKSMDQSCRL